MTTIATVDRPGSGGGGGGVSAHSALTGLDAAGSHPISAITNLDRALISHVQAVSEGPAEDFGWNPTTQPWPITAFVPDNNLDNLKILLLNQETYTDGIYDLGTDSHENPPTLIEEWPLDPVAAGTAEEKLARLARYVFNQDLLAGGANTGLLGPYMTQMGETLVELKLSARPTHVGGVFTTNQDVDSAVGSAGSHYLLTAQSDTSENGVWYATPSRLVRSRALAPSYTAGFTVFDTATGLRWIGQGGTAWVLSDGSYSPTISDNWDTPPVLTTHALDELAARMRDAEEIPANYQDGSSYTLVLADAGRVVEMSNAGVNTLTVPPNSEVAFPAGTIIEVCQIGAGTTTIAEGSGVTIQNQGDIAEQFGTVSLRKRATNEWVLSGAVA